MKKNLTTKAVREYWGEALSADEYVSHPYGVTYEVYEYEGDTLGKYVETVPYTDFFTTKLMVSSKSSGVSISKR